MLAKIVTFTGTGANLSVTGAGFKPDAIIVKNPARTYDTWFSTKEMYTDNVVYSLPIRADGGGDKSHILSLDNDGFTVSSDAAVNQSGDQIIALCLKDDGLGDFGTVSYVGDSTDDKLVFSAFKPDWSVVKANAGIVGAQKFANMASGTASGQQSSNVASPNYQGASDRPDLIRFDTAGMYVSNGDSSGGNLVNQSGANHYGIVMKNSANFYAFTYQGDGTTGRVISSTFKPVFLDIMSATGGRQVVTQYTPQQSGGFTQPWDGSQTTGKVSAVSASGVTIGSDSAVNTNGETYWYMFVGEKTAAVIPAPTTTTASLNVGASRRFFF